MVKRKREKGRKIRIQEYNFLSIDTVSSTELCSIVGTAQIDAVVHTFNMLHDTLLSAIRGRYDEYRWSFDGGLWKRRIVDARIDAEKTVQTGFEIFQRINAINRKHRLGNGRVIALRVVAHKGKVVFSGPTWGTAFSPALGALAKYEKQAVNGEIWRFHISEDIYEDLPNKIQKKFELGGGSISEIGRSGGTRFYQSQRLFGGPALREAHLRFRDGNPSPMGKKKTDSINSVVKKAKSLMKKNEHRKAYRMLLKAHGTDRLNKSFLTLLVSICKHLGWMATAGQYQQLLGSRQE
ncbi:MAG: hypothetical protein A3G34_04165 [Candidatus Lindowbacteria bacterium RIFCSPLOWO2_12_FULL_62_27]|nr:MAG: hypothetical protein A3G34_04165 [Candidatus Lindowbacteria bacterium RIFCSPLOWO2_12_FULL_62_27]